MRDIRADWKKWTLGERIAGMMIAGSWLFAVAAVVAFPGS
jgi:hypothetical protein